MNLYQDFIVLRSRLLDLFKFKNIRWSVFFGYNRFHGDWSTSQVRLSCVELTRLYYPGALRV